ncbi:MAG: hypothetical protein NUV69_01470 [Candidatus Curtissbacteria bacterium]|nr:hypothetical protein [Candidatus Curtissbacteria bacterium]
MSLLETYIVLSIIRLVAGFSILKWPLFGLFASIFIDVYDFNFLPFANNGEREAYQLWDKIFDIYYLAIAAFTSLSWKDQLARKIAVSSFLYRLTGAILFPLIGNRSLLIFFPNFFENFFIFYLLFVRLTKKQKLFTSRISVFIIIVALLIPSILREYFMHVLKKPPWRVYDIAQNLDIQKWAPFGIDLSYLIWILILLSLPLTALIWQVKKVKSR